MKFICGQLGGRDHYQLPAALAEMNRLEIFYTDFYLRRKWQRFLAEHGAVSPDRFFPGLDPRFVKNSYLAVLIQKATDLLIRDDELRRMIPDRWLSRILRRKADHLHCHLMTFEPWVVARPPGGFSGHRKQILFHFHPHVDREDAIYAEDQRRFPEFYGQTKVTESPWRKRTANAWRQADMVLCASSFTRDSLLAAGMRPELCRVVPYGVKPPQVEGRTAKQGPLKLLFVGRNPLRKGLHHLLTAWRQAGKREGDRLTVVCAARDRAVRELAARQGDVEWRESVSGEELSRLYQEADALVVPSLCEGFGHVYLEAMGHGCAAVGTGHSALPDLGGESEGVFVVPAGEVEALAGLIGRASKDPGVFRSRGEAAKIRAAEFTWMKFREGVKTVVRQVTGD